MDDIQKECKSKEEAYNKCYIEYKYWKDKAKEYKHRAEVAERALLKAVYASKYHCIECPVVDCYVDINGSLECIQRICEEYEKRAEKELQKKNEQM